MAAHGIFFHLRAWVCHAINIGDHPDCSLDDRREEIENEKPRFGSLTDRTTGYPGEIMSGFTIIKIVVSALLITAISEVARRSSLMGAILASIPLVSVLAMIWMYIENQDNEKISSLSVNIFWMVIPSLVLFITLPVLLKSGVNFFISMGISIGLTSLSYWIMVIILNHFGIKF